MRTLLAALIVLGLAGCANTYEQIVTGTDGKITIYEETHNKAWWTPPFEADYMSLRHSRTVREGQIIAEKTCRQETANVLTCHIEK